MPGYVLAKTTLPIEDTDLANEYLAELVAMDGKIETVLSAEAVGQVAMDPIRGKIIYEGVEYYATDTKINSSPSSKRMPLTGIRWD